MSQPEPDDIYEQHEITEYELKQLRALPPPDKPFRRSPVRGEAMSQPNDVPCLTKERIAEDKKLCEEFYHNDVHLLLTARARSALPQYIALCESQQRVNDAMGKRLRECEQSFVYARNEVLLLGAEIAALREQLAAKDK